MDSCFDDLFFYGIHSDILDPLFTENLVNWRSSSKATKHSKYIGDYDEMIQNYICHAVSINRSAHVSQAHRAGFCSKLAGVRMNFHLSEDKPGPGKYRIEKFAITMLSAEPTSAEKHPECKKFKQKASEHMEQLAFESEACYKDIAVLDITITAAKAPG